MKKLMFYLLCQPCYYMVGKVTIYLERNTHMKDGKFKAFIENKKDNNRKIKCVYPVLLNFM